MVSLNPGWGVHGEGKGKGSLKNQSEKWGNCRKKVSIKIGQTQKFKTLAP